MSESTERAITSASDVGGIRLRTCMVLAVLGLVLLMSAVNFIISYNLLRRNALLGIENKLSMAADMTREALPDQYHDGLTGVDSIRPSEYTHIGQKFDHLCIEHGIQSVWSVMEVDGAVRYTSSSSRHTSSHEGYAEFWAEYPNSQILSGVFRNMTVQYVNLEDDWGMLRTVLKPSLDSQGRKIIVGASVRLDAVNALLRHHLKTSVIGSLVICLVGGAFGLFLANRAAIVANTLAERVQRLSQCDFEETAPVRGVHELRILASCFNTMKADLKHQIEALKDSEQRYRNFVVNASEGIYRLDFKQPVPIDLDDAALVAAINENSYVGEVNESLARMYDYAPQDMVGRPTTDFAPDYGERALLVVRSPKHIIRDKETLDVDRYGNPLYLAESYTAIIEDGLLTRIWGVQRDVTRNKRAETALRESEERMEMALHGAELGTWDWRIQSGEVNFNDRWAAILGYESKELKPHVSTWQSLLHPDDTPSTMKALNAQLDGDTDTYETEYRMRHKSGDWVWILDRGRVIERDENGRPLRACGTHLDITKRKRVEMELSETRRTLEAAIAQSPSGILIADAPDVTIRIANAAAFNIRGGDTGILTGINVEQIATNWQTYKPDGSPYPSDQLPLARAVLHGEETRNEELIVRNENGENRWVSANAAPIRDSRGAISAGILILHDITDRRRATEALEKRLVALTQPRADSTGVTFDDLFNLEDIQRIQDDFARAAGVASIITDVNGTPITKASNFCRLCRDIIRPTEKGRANCQRSDAILGKPNPEGPIVQPCMSGGLWDAGASITVGGKHIANWLIGQVRNESQDEGCMREYAREIGADEQDFMQAFLEVTVMSREQFNNVARALFTLANQLSSIAYQNLQQARFITDRKQASEALRESERLFRGVFNQAHQLVCVLKPDGALVAFNNTAKQVSGVEETEVLGKPFWETPWWSHSKEEQTRIKKAIEQAAAGIFVRFETTHPTPDGGLLNIDFTITPLKDEDGEVVLLIPEGRDITESKRVMQALQESEARYRVTVEQTGQVVYDYEPVTGQIHWHGAIERITGYSPDEFAEVDITRWGELVHPEDRPGILKQLNLAQEQCGRFDVTYRLRKKNDEYVHVEEHGVFLPGQDGEAVHMLGSILDVSERIAAEREKAKLEDQLRQSQKLEAIGQLAGGVAHDFNNILTAIMGNIELSIDELNEETSSRESLLEAMTQIDHSARRASALTRQLLAFSRRQISQPEVLNLNAVLDSLRKMLPRLITENISLKILPGDKLTSVRADAGQIEQAIVNLVINAVDAMPDGGVLTIETQNIELDENYRSHHLEARLGPHVMLAVSDTGHGMDERTRDRVFEPFFTTKPVNKGTGLGLSTVHGIVKQAGGHLTVYSEIGAGSSFKIYLPSVDEEAVDKSTSDSQQHDLKGGETILLCEDDNTVRGLTTMLLKSAGYEVVAVSCGKDALEKSREDTRFDLLITDVIMTDMNGREVSDALTSDRPGLPTLFISGYTSNVIAHHGVLDDDVEFLEKPFTRTQLLTHVRKLLDKVGSKQT